MFFNHKKTCSKYKKFLEHVTTFHAMALSAMDLFCYEVLDFFDEPLTKKQKMTNERIETLPLSAKDMEMYFALLENRRISEFLDYDKYFQYADKYLLAMVMTYFKRAGYSYEEYNAYNFFVALYLAHDMEEDEEELKYAFTRWIFDSKWEEKYNCLLISRNKLWKSMNFRAVVSKKCCEEVISMLPDHPAWKRQRSEYYGGAKRAEIEEVYQKSPNTLTSSCRSKIISSHCGCSIAEPTLYSPGYIETDYKKKPFMIDNVEGNGNQKKKGTIISKDIYIRLQDKIEVTLIVKNGR